MFNTIGIVWLVLVCSVQVFADGDNRFPYLASIQAPGNFGRRHACGGTIISADIVITAAHCLGNFNSPKALSVRVGKTEWSIGDVAYEVEQSFTHPQYNIDELNYDVAILKLTEKIQFSAGVQQVRIANSIETVPKTGSGAGWQQQVGRGGAKPELKVTNFWVVHQTNRNYNRYCGQLSATDEPKQRKHFICARAASLTEAETGGPFVDAEGQLAGIVVDSSDSRPNAGEIILPINAIRKWMDDILQQAS